MAIDGEIYIVPFFGQGHLFPAMELCKHLSTRNYKITLIISSNLSSSVPSALRHHPLVEIAEVTDAPAPAPPPEAAGGSGPEPGPGSNPFHRRHQQMGTDIESFLSSRASSPTRPVCAVIDVMMSWSKEVFGKFKIPTTAFFTSGACSAAMEYAAWKAQARDMKPGEIRVLSGLPEDMALTYTDIERRSHRPPHVGPDSGPPGRPGGPGMPPGGLGGPPPGLPGMSGGPKFGPPVPGNQPAWLDEVDGSVAMLINTCDDLERTFLEYIAKQTGKPVWGVGPLLPEQYWKSAGSVLHDGEIRSTRQSNYTEDEVIQWLDSKPRESVVYVSFGSEVGPTLEEYAQLADALGESKWPFIWVIQPGSGRRGPPPGFLGGKPGLDPSEEGYYPHGLDCKIGDRGLIIRGWAPQLMILSHPSTGGFLSHCGWNSTVEAIGRGVPFLAWPIRGDQFYNAKLVVSHLKLGYRISSGEQAVAKEDIVEGIERLMTDEEVHKRAVALVAEFESGFPVSSAAALDAFRDFIGQKSA